MLQPQLPCQQRWSASRAQRPRQDGRPAAGRRCVCGWYGHGTAYFPSCSENGFGAGRIAGRGRGA